MDGGASVGAFGPGARRAADHAGCRHRGRSRPELGPRCVARFGPRLPFLLKLLSADRALSIQVHPSRAQAEAGFRAENERGLRAGRPGPQLQRRLAQARAAVRPDPVRGGGRPAHPGRRGRHPARAGRRATRAARGPARGRADRARAGRGVRDRAQLAGGRTRRTRRRCADRLQAAGRRGRALRGRLRGGGAQRRGSSRRSRPRRPAADAAHGAATGSGGVHARRRSARSTSAAPASRSWPTPTTWSGPV